MRVGCLYRIALCMGNTTLLSAAWSFPYCFEERDCVSAADTNLVLLFRNVIEPCFERNMLFCGYGFLLFVTFSRKAILLHARLERSLFLQRRVCRTYQPALFIVPMCRASVVYCKQCGHRGRSAVGRAVAPWRAERGWCYSGVGLGGGGSEMDGRSCRHLPAAAAESFVRVCTPHRLLASPLIVTVCDLGDTSGGAALPTQIQLMTPLAALCPSRCRPAGSARHRAGQPRPWRRGGRRRRIKLGRSDLHTAPGTMGGGGLQWAQFGHGRIRRRREKVRVVWRQVLRAAFSCWPFCICMSMQ